MLRRSVDRRAGWTNGRDPSAGGRDRVDESMRIIRKGPSREKQKKPDGRNGPRAQHADLPQPGVWSALDHPRSRRRCAPTATRTAAIPRLNAESKTRPAASRPTASERSRSTTASQHGTAPLASPRATKAPGSASMRPGRRRQCSPYSPRCRGRAARGRPPRSGNRPRQEPAGCKRAHRVAQRAARTATTPRTCARVTGRGPADPAVPASPPVERSGGHERLAVARLDGVGAQREGDEPEPQAGRRERVQQPREPIGRRARSATEPEPRPPGTRLRHPAPGPNRTETRRPPLLGVGQLPDRAGGNLRHLARQVVAADHDPAEPLTASRLLSLRRSRSSCRGP